MTNARASRAKRAATPKPPNRISDQDLERHQLMVSKLREAQLLEQRAGELASAFKIWAEELHERYGLASDGTENIAEDGTITRH